MKKKNIFLTLLALFFLSINIINAEGNTCDAKTKSKLMSLASNITITYELDSKTVKSDAATVAEYGVESYVEEYINVKIYNLSSKLRVRAINNKSNKTFDVNYRYIGKDGAVTISRLLSSETSTYTFDVYGLDTCGDVKLRTFKLTVPRYNYLADTDICADIQDFYMCQPLVTYEIDDNIAYKQIEEYSKKANNKKEDNNNNSNAGVITRKINKLSNNKKYIALVVVLAGAFITLIILKRKKSDR